ncbi:hypothetical protein AOCH_005610 [Aspergillus ochraceoroseus]|uniref:Uncharacterized protein n=1 Tax=Aspergillus ochraceoroseus TaxID=138278 RepID=A0A0F8V6J8_9EURO|nr:hypothetical protein AOCH_005610 [Aspergillus ochraceoroseus]
MPYYTPAQELNSYKPLQGFSAMNISSLQRSPQSPFPTSSIDETRLQRNSYRGYTEMWTQCVMCTHIACSYCSRVK